MKYLWTVIAAPVILLVLICRAESRMPWRAFMQILPNNESKEWTDDEKRKYRQKEYKGVLIFWAIFTVGTLIYSFFFLI